MIRFIFNRIKTWVGWMIIFALTYHLLPLIWDVVPKLTKGESAAIWTVIILITVSLSIDGAIDYKKKQ